MTNIPEGGIVAGAEAVLPGDANQRVAAADSAIGWRSGAYNLVLPHGQKLYSIRCNPIR